MQRLLLILCFIYICISIDAQVLMRIHYNDGQHTDIPTDIIDSLTFITGDDTQEKSTLIGNWFWGNQIKGYYELLTFKDDYTYTGYDYFFTYGFDTQTYGWYSNYSSMITLWSNGFGYQRRFNWFITTLTPNALEVITNMGHFTYYKLQNEILLIKVNEYILCKDGDFFVFADGVTATIENNKLIGLSIGTTYVEKFSAETGLIYAYKVIVE